MLSKGGWLSQSSVQHPVSSIGGAKADAHPVMPEHGFLRYVCLLPPSKRKKDSDTALGILRQCGLFADMPGTLLQFLVGRMDFLDAYVGQALGKGMGVWRADELPDDAQSPRGVRFGRQGAEGAAEPLDGGPAGYYLLEGRVVATDRGQRVLYHPGDLVPRETRPVAKISTACLVLGPVEMEKVQQFRSEQSRMAHTQKLKQILGPQVSQNFKGLPHKWFEGATEGSYGKFLPECAMQLQDLPFGAVVSVDPAREAGIVLEGEVNFRVAQRDLCLCGPGTWLAASILEEFTARCASAHPGGVHGQPGLVIAWFRGEELDRFKLEPLVGRRLAELRARLEAQRASQRQVQPRVAAATQRARGHRDKKDLTHQYLRMPTGPRHQPPPEHHVAPVPRKPAHVHQAKPPSLRTQRTVAEDTEHQRGLHVHEKEADAVTNLTVLMTVGGVGAGSTEPVQVPALRPFKPHVSAERFQHSGLPGLGGYHPDGASIPTATKIRAVLGNEEQDPLEREPSYARLTEGNLRNAMERFHDPEVLRERKVVTSLLQDAPSEASQDFRRSCGADPSRSGQFFAKVERDRERQGLAASRSILRPKWQRAVSPTRSLTSTQQSFPKMPWAFTAEGRGPPAPQAGKEPRRGQAFARQAVNPDVVAAAHKLQLYAEPCGPPILRSARRLVTAGSSSAGDPLQQSPLQSPLITGIVPTPSLG